MSADYPLISDEYELVVPFYDVDSMGVVWHGNYVKYFERARCQLLDKIGYGYNAMLASGYGWPVVDMKIKYAAPALFDSRLLVKSTLKDYENGLLIDYEIFDQANNVRTTKGHTRQVAVAIDSREMQICSPNILLEKIKAYHDKNAKS